MHLYENFLEPKHTGFIEDVPITLIDDTLISLPEVRIIEGRL